MMAVSLIRLVSSIMEIVEPMTRLLGQVSDPFYSNLENHGSIIAPNYTSEKTVPLDDG